MPLKPQQGQDDLWSLILSATCFIYSFLTAAFLCLPMAQQISHTQSKWPHNSSGQHICSISCHVPIGEGESPLSSPTLALFSLIHLPDHPLWRSLISSWASAGTWPTTAGPTGGRGASPQAPKQLTCHPLLPTLENKDFFPGMPEGPCATQHLLVCAYFIFT